MVDINPAYVRGGIKGGLNNGAARSWRVDDNAGTRWGWTGRLATALFTDASLLLDVIRDVINEACLVPLVTAAAVEWV